MNGNASSNGITRDLEAMQRVGLGGALIFNIGEYIPKGPIDYGSEQWLNLMTAANRDPRMGTAYTRTLNDWQAAGGQIYALYNHVYKPSKYGVWGLKETEYQENNVKWQAVLPYRDTKQCWWAGCTR